MPQLASTAPASSFVGSVRGADGSSGGDGIASAASREAVAEGTAETDADGNGSDIVTALGTTAVAITTATTIIIITITNRDGVIDDPVRVRDDHHHGDGTGDGRIDVATGNGAEHRAVRRCRSRGRGGSRHRRDAERRWRGAQLPPEKRGRAAP